MLEKTEERFMDKELKIDMHVHSSGISFCSHATCEEIITYKKSLGYDGAVLTNHCQAWYYAAEKQQDFMRSVVEEFKRGKAYADERNFRFYLGIEVTITDPAYSDWLLYGVTEEALLRAPCLYRLNQRQLFSFCQENGIVLIQAHPYRKASYCDDQHPGEVKYLHGVEINCSPGDIERRGDILEFAEKNNVTVTCGTDYHGDRRIFGGTLLPATVQTGEDIAEYLRTTDKTRIFFEKEILEIPVRRK